MLETVRERHAAYYLTLAEQARPFLEKPEPAWLDRLESEHDNLRAALTYFAAQEAMLDQAVQLAAALIPFWRARGYIYEQMTWVVGLALRPTPPTQARVHLLGQAAMAIAIDRGDFLSAKRMLTEMLQIARQLEIRVGIANALNGLAWLMNEAPSAGSEHDPVAARALAEESLAIMRELGDRQGMANALFMLGRLASGAGDHDTARTRWLECRSLDQELGVKGGLVLKSLGELALERGDYAGARDYFETFLIERHEIGEHWGIMWGLQGLSAVAWAQGEPKRAARLLGASLTVRESIAVPLSAEGYASYEARQITMREALGAAALAVAWEAGHSMTCEEAVRFALSEGLA